MLTVIINEQVSKYKATRTKPEQAVMGWVGEGKAWINPFDKRGQPKNKLK